MIIPARRLAPRAFNYRLVRRRGLGDNVPGQVSPDGNFAWDGRVWQPVNAAPAAPTFTPVVQPTNEVCQPWDTPCVMRNVARQTGYQIAEGQNSASQLYGNCLAGGTDAATCRARWPVGYAGDVPFMNLPRDQQVAEAAQGGFSIPAPVAPAVPAAPVASGGSVHFQSSRGGTLVYPGDTWTVTISGASPNLPVQVQGGKNGASNTTPMGSTDSAGNFSLSGRFTQDDIGSWVENWSVGGRGSGSFNFTVGSVPTTSTGKPIVDTSSAANAPGGAPAPDGGPATKQGAPSSSIGGAIPWWGWLAGVGAAIFLMKGNR